MDGGRPLEVGVVGAPHEAVDADLLSHLRLLALHQRPAQEHVALEVLRRAQFEVGAHGRTAVGVEERLHVPDQGRQPLNAVLRTTTLSFGWRSNTPPKIMNQRGRRVKTNTS